MSSHQDNILGVGIAAFGLSGRIFHAPYILSHPKFKLKVVYKRSKSKSIEFCEIHGYKNVDLVRSLDDLCSRTDISVVVVCSPIWCVRLTS